MKKMPILIENEKSIYIYNRHLYSIKMINTYNETSLHLSLKKLYAIKYNGTTEIPVEKYICDIVTDDDSIIEIQTGSLLKLLPKLIVLLKNHKVRLVHPLTCIKYIETHSSNGEKISRRKSPKRKDIYYLFDELMGIHPILLNKNFTLEVLLTTQTEIRRTTAEPVQSLNNRRRFKKNWIKTDKILDSISDTYIFKSKKDYLALLPHEIPKEFNAKDLSKTDVKNNSYKMLWVLNKMELLDFCGKINNKNTYKIK